MKLKIQDRSFSVEDKLLLHFQSKNAVFKFIRRSVDGASIWLSIRLNWFAKKAFVYLIEWTSQK